MPAEYQSWPASKKQEFLWESRILRSKYDVLPPLKKIDVIGLFLTALRKKMDRQSDEAPVNWEKAIHAHGSVATIEFAPTPNTPFTGLFEGANYGLVRLSLTGDPVDRGFAPGVAVKFLVDGSHSENFSALVSLTGQEDNYNFFANEFSNIVPVVNQLGPKLINLIFRRVTKFPAKLYLQGFALTDQTGKKVAAPHYPTQIFLVPSQEVQFPDSPAHDFRADLINIPVGALLFSVYAIDPLKVEGDATNNPDYRQQAQLIGLIKTTSEFVSSFYGDSQLFFRHQRFQNR